MSKSKPKCELSGVDGNIFCLIGKASRALKKDGQHAQAKEVTSKIMSTDISYEEALSILGEYVEVE